MTGDEVLTRSTVVYRTGTLVSHCVLRLWNRYRVFGLEHVPRRGPALVVANHQSYVDIPLLAAALWPRHVSFVARGSLAQSRAMAFIMRQSGAVLIRRGQADRAALREMSAHLDGGDLVVVFPEGTRSRDGRMGAFRGGALLAARQSGVPVLPAGVRGTGRALPRGALWLRPARLEVRFGPPEDPGGPDALARVRSAVAALAEPAPSEAEPLPARGSPLTPETPPSPASSVQCPVQPPPAAAGGRAPLFYSRP